LCFGENKGHINVVRTRTGPLGVKLVVVVVQHFTLEYIIGVGKKSWYIKDEIGMVDDGGGCKKHKLGEERKERSAGQEEPWYIY
jgi:hypothetical protein